MFEEDVLPLQGAADRAADRLLERGRQRDQHGIGDVDHVRLRLRAQPVNELVELLPLMAVPALQNRYGQLAQLLRLRLHTALRDRAQQPRRLPQAVEQPGRAAKEAGVLLQVDADAAEEDPVLADAGLVGARGRVERHEEHIVPELSQGLREGVVADAASAVHAAGAGGNRNDAHRVRGGPRWRPRSGLATWRNYSVAAGRLQESRGEPGRRSWYALSPYPPADRPRRCRALSESQGTGRRDPATAAASGR